MKIDLGLKKSLDLDAVEKGHPFYIHRVFARFWFREAEAKWGEEKLDSHSVSKPFSFPALLADSPHVPIIIGFAKLLERVKLVVDFPENRGHLEF